MTPTSHSSAFLVTKLDIVQGFEPYATHTENVGTDPKDAQELLGHANISTTQQVYQHGNLATQRASLERIAQTIVGGDVATQTATHNDFPRVTAPKTVH